MASTGKAILAALRPQLNLSDYRKKHWEGSFDEYLDIVREHPEVTRTAYQRLYDMILSHGTEEVYEQKEKLTRFKFFTDFAAQHGDAIYGLDRPLMALVNAFKSAAKGYGTERRVLLLHGPVGSSKSTIARLLKKGLELYSRSDEGMLFSYAWKGEGGTWHKCPMHEDPLHLVPFELRPALLVDDPAELRPEGAVDLRALHAPDEPDVLLAVGAHVVGEARGLGQDDLHWVGGGAKNTADLGAHLHRV